MPPKRYLDRRRIPSVCWGATDPTVPHHGAAWHCSDPQHTPRLAPRAIPVVASTPGWVFPGFDPTLPQPPHYTLASNPRGAYGTIPNPGGTPSPSGDSFRKTFGGSV